MPRAVSFIAEDLRFTESLELAAWDRPEVPSVRPDHVAAVPDRAAFGNF
jgi:hypothetical protein